MNPMYKEHNHFASRCEESKQCFEVVTIINCKAKDLKKELSAETDNSICL